MEGKWQIHGQKTLSKKTNWAISNLFHSKVLLVDGSYGGFHIHLLVLPFVYQFYTRMTTLVESTFWNLAEIITFQNNRLNYILVAILVANRSRRELTRLKCKWTRKWEGKDVDESPLYALKIFFFTKAIFGPLLMLFIWCDCDQTIIISCQRISGTEKQAKISQAYLGCNYVLTMRKNRLIDCFSAYDSVSGDWRLMKVTARQLMVLLYLMNNFIQFIHLWSI